MGGPPIRKKAGFQCATNIALIKYWGKRDLPLNLPMNSSISATLPGLFTRTTVEHLDSGEDELWINDKRFPDTGKIRRVKEHLGVADWSLRVRSTNNFPTASGLASSASGLAAFVGALFGLLEGERDTTSMSIAARIGSGSASRSFFGPFAVWDKGERSDGTDSHARPCASHPSLADLVCTIIVISDKPKEVSSTGGMQTSVRESPHYREWLEHIDEDLRNMERFLAEGDFGRMGLLMEENALLMHKTTVPPYAYFTDETRRTLDAIRGFREREGVSCYFTMDAGPNIKVFSFPEGAERLRGFLSGGPHRLLTSAVGEMAFSFEPDV